MIPRTKQTWRTPKLQLKSALVTEADSCAPERAFDPSLVGQHSYLSEVDDLQCEQQLLEDGRGYRVPLVITSGTLPSWDWCRAEWGDVLVTVTFRGMVPPVAAIEAVEMASLERALVVVVVAVPV